MVFRKTSQTVGLPLLACLFLAHLTAGPAGAIGGPRPVTVSVEGEVRNPGTHALPHDATLSTLIVAAGGYTDNAELSGATLLRGATVIPVELSHPRLMKNSPRDVPLNEGDTLRIPSRVPGAPARPTTRRTAGEPFDGPNNFGVTGLFETPDARPMRGNRYRLGSTYVHPYRFYYGTVGLFERVEVNARVTQVIGVPGFNDNGAYGDFKDKAVDAKFLLLKEGKFLPAVAVTISDPHGTRLQASQAVVAGKRIGPFDLSLGFGNGRLGRRPLPSQGEGFRLELLTDPAKWAREALPFGGVRFAATPWLSLLAEYSPVRYERQTQDPAQPKYFPSAVASPVNLGVRVKPLRWLDLTASWQRGSELGISASVDFEIGRPLVPIYDPPYRERPEAARLPLSDRIGLALSEAGFSDIGVESDGFHLRVDARNDRYFFTPRAAAVLFETIAPFVPPTVEYVRVVFTENGIPVAEATVPGPALTEARGTADLRERIGESTGFRSSDFSGPAGNLSHRRRYDYHLKPSFATFLNDPSGFFKYRLGAAGGVTVYPWKGGASLLELDAHPLNNISTSNAPLSIPVRSDVAEYMRQDVSLGRLLFAQTFASREPAYLRLEAGMLERMFGGADGEAAIPLWSGRVLAGASGSVVRKRAPDGTFGFRGGADHHTVLLLGRLNVPEIGSALDVKAGRFLAGDKGVRISASKFIGGVTLSAWYSATSTTMFTDPYNRGYHDKGIAVDIPIRLFAGRDSRTVYRYSLSPWTRDVAQDIDRHQPLFDLIGRNAGPLLDTDRPSMYKDSR
ncbi:MAG: YjbH domain-containing protein [Deltaproteobacteria bacterium]|nr:YjbH domain-containing protein [Deltaproteobacteria bacterium]